MLRLLLLRLDLILSLLSYSFQSVNEQIDLYCEVHFITAMSSSQEGRAVEATARMTLDEMLAKYPKRSVEQAVIHRNYKEYGLLFPPVNV